MKLLKSLDIDGKPKQLISSNIILELNACGRGFIVINSDKSESFKHKIVRIEIGYQDSVTRFFTGYVENEQESSMGTRKLMIRELIGIYANQINCSFQHPTLKDITDFLTQNYGLDFDLPEASYINIKIPHFKHSGSGYHLLKSLGITFNIDDFVFYQKATGEIYLGSYEDSFYHGRAVDYGDDLNKAAIKTASASSVTLPFIPKLRPGVTLNQRRVRQVSLLDDELTITFDNNEQNAFEKQVEKNKPEISAGYHLPMFGRVVAITDICHSGDISTPFRPKYAVDVQLLDEKGMDAKIPIYKAVPLPVALGGFEKGAFCYPDIGAIVDIAFAYGRADQPMVRNVYPTNLGLPSVSHGEMLLQQRPDVFQRIDKIGNTIRATDQELHDNSRDHYTTSDYKQNNFTERQTTITANDTTHVLGNGEYCAGSHTTATINDYGLAVGGEHNHSVTLSYTCEIGANKSETIAKHYQLNANSYNASINQAIQITANQINEQAQTIYSIIAGSSVQVIAPTVWLGSNQINVTQCMLDTLQLIKRLADLTASHTHSNTSTPTNSSAMSSIASDATSTNNKYASIIAK